MFLAGHYVQNGSPSKSGGLYSGAGLGVKIHGRECRMDTEKTMQRGSIYCRWWIGGAVGRSKDDMISFAMTHFLLNIAWFCSIMDKMTFLHPFLADPLVYIAGMKGRKALTTVFTASRICHRIRSRKVFVEVNMRISYRPLWVMLAQREMSKKELREQSGISTASLAKLGKGENLTTDVLLKICQALDCNINQIIETIPDESGAKEDPDA